LYLLLQVDFGITKPIFQNNQNAGANTEAAENFLEKKDAEIKHEIYSERTTTPTTPDQTPLIKANLRKVCLSIQYYIFIIVFPRYDQ